LVVHGVEEEMGTRLRFKSLRTRLAFWFLVVTMLSLVTVVAILYF